MITVENFMSYITNTSVTKLIITFIALCILCVSVLYSLSVNFVRVLGKMSEFLKNIDTIGYGKFVIQLHKNNKDKSKVAAKPVEEPKTQTNSNERVFDIDFFMGILDIIISTEFKSVIDSCINATNGIQRIEKEYDERVADIFTKTFSTVYNNLHSELVNLIYSKTDIEPMNVKNTKEYFFIDTLMAEYKQTWMELSKEITKRNGFVEFLHDKSKCEDYVTELTSSINECVHMDRLESTELKKSDVDKVIALNAESCRTLLENMFISLARIKTVMLDKRAGKLKLIEDNIKNSVPSTLSKIKSKILIFYTMPVKQILVTDDKTSASK